MKHDFRYFFREGIRNMFSHGFMSFAAIGVTVACLVIMGTFSLVDRKSTRLNSSHPNPSRMPSSA